MSLFDCDQLIGWTSSINAELAPLHGRTLPLTEKKKCPEQYFYFEDFNGKKLSRRAQVTATDGDKDRPQNIVYFLTGQGIDADNKENSKFDINRTTGEIYVLKVSASFPTVKRDTRSSLIIDFWLRTWKPID